MASIVITPMNAPLGAQVEGLDLCYPLGEAVRSTLRQALLDHLVLMVHDQALDDDTQYRFARCFGRPAPVRSGPSRDDASREVLLVANVTQPGARSVLGDGAMDFHIDQCYCEAPVKATTLHALEVPARVGDTVFINGYLAYDALPESMKRRIFRLNAVNAYDTERNLMLRVRPPRTDAPHWTHPMVRVHPDTGRRSIFFNRLMTDCIEGMSRAASDALLGRLFELTEQQRFMYQHRWRVGDLLVWDNRCTLHGRTDFDPAERRKLQRVALSDESLQTAGRATAPRVVNCAGDGVVTGSFRG